MANKGPSQRTLSLQVASRNAPRGYVEQEVSAYNLKWTDLRKWLVEERFHNTPELDRVLVQNMVSGAPFAAVAMPPLTFLPLRSASRTSSTSMCRKH